MGGGSVGREDEESSLVQNRHRKPRGRLQGLPPGIITYTVATIFPFTVSWDPERSETWVEDGDERDGTRGQ